jgi:hypothetical protein
MMEKFKEETGAIGPDISKLAKEQAYRKAARKAQEKPPSDMFERGEMDSPEYRNPFSHANFLKDLRESIKTGAKKILTEEEGFIDPEMLGFKRKTPQEKVRYQNVRGRTKDWIFQRNAAPVWGKRATERVKADPLAAHDIIDEMWKAQRRAYADPLPYEDLSPEGVGEYVTKVKVRLANQHYKNYLDREGLLTEKRKVNKEDPLGQKVQKWIDNHTKEAPGYTKHMGDFASWFKNIYLAGGIPETPLNIHGYNIGRSDVMARGVGKGLKSFGEAALPERFGGGKADYAILEKYKDLIPEAIEKGFTWHDIEDVGPGKKTPIPLAEFAKRTKGGRAIMGGVEKIQSAFEDPLFQRYLPARKLEFLAEKVDELQKSGLPRDQALRKASTMANDFYGGVEKVLRDRGGNNLLKAIALAPDWFESRLKLGYKGAKALAGKEDPTYAKAMGRALGMRLTRDAAILAGGGSLVKAYKEAKPGDVTSIPLGQTEEGKNRLLPTLGTAAEGLRLTEEGLNRAIRARNPGVAFRVLENRLSQPAASAGHLLFNVDEFGNPIYGTSKFGKSIGMGKGIANIANELSKSFQPQQVQATIDYLEGKIGLEEALAKGAELPLKYTSTRSFGRVRRRR